MGKVCVLGLGYIGLPTASVLATSGFRVVGVDVNESVVNIVNSGESHIEEPGLRALVQAAVGSGNLCPTLKPEKADVFIIAVPTPLTDDKRPDMSFVEHAIESIIPLVDRGNLIILESTSPPGTTCNLVAPLLERSGLKVGKELYVSYCPERVLPGNILKEIIENDRVIGGVNRRSAERAAELYSTFVEGEIFITDATTAEMVKIMENTYRDVNIALANELARLCESLGINVWEVIELANRHPRVNIHKPGPGVGGHCLPIDPWFLIDRFPQDARLIRTAREVNDSQPEFVFTSIQRMVEEIENPKVTLLGVTYKGNIDDTRESPALQLIDLLQHQGYMIGIHDPHAKSFPIKLDGLEEALDQSDCIVVLVDHEKFRLLEPVKVASIVRTRQVLDTKRVLDRGEWEKAGFKARLLGSGLWNRDKEF